MRLTELENVVSKAKCRVSGHHDADTDSQRRLLARFIHEFDDPATTIFCEPSLARSSKRPPDIVILDPIAGLHVIEVKGHTLDGIDGIDPGGQIRFRYENGISTKSPIAQVRSAMFDIKNETEKSLDGELLLPFHYWVIFPNIDRAKWNGTWSFCPHEFLFREDLNSVSQKFREAAKGKLSSRGLDNWPSEQLNAVHVAFGDSSVLYHQPGERENRRVKEGTLGERFDEAAEAYKTLSEEQDRLSKQNWEEGPRLIRGVAGSGKTIVLANNAARRLQKRRKNPSLFTETKEQRTILVVCQNRSLVPLLEKKISLAFEQRTGKPLEKDGLNITSFNALMFELSKKGIWRYQSFKSNTADEISERYLMELVDLKARHPEMVEQVAFEAVFVDEGQDFQENEFKILKELCYVTGDQEPNLYVFYDDAQNIFGKQRPNWSSIGLNIRGGRASVMNQCFRNTRAIVEAAFNVLYGTSAMGDCEKPTRDFADLQNLEEKNLVKNEGDFFRVSFAVRSGMSPRLTIAGSVTEELQQIHLRLKYLIEEQQVRPQDILVLAMRNDTVMRIAEILKKSPLKGVDEVHISASENDKNKMLCRRSTLTLSTTASAKGYDAYCVLLASANEFAPSVTGRINFYVGCTRAIEYLEVFANKNEGLVAEFAKVIDFQNRLRKEL